MLHAAVAVVVFHAGRLPIEDVLHLAVAHTTSTITQNLSSACSKAACQLLWCICGAMQSTLWVPAAGSH